jgi:hypothetical protein
VPAAVGRQLTVTSPTAPQLLNEMLTLADSRANRVDLIAHGVQDSLNRGWLYDRSTGQFQSARNGEQIRLHDLLAGASPDTELTFTIVPLGSGVRLGVDRDNDYYFDLTEVESGFDPLDPNSHGSNAPPQVIAPPPAIVHPGMTISQRFLARDPDMPQQTLTLHLTRDVPAGSSFDPQTGLFTWTPATDQGDRLWRIGVGTTDDGPLPLSEGALFEINVMVPRLKDFAVRLNPDGQYEAAMSLQSITNLYYVLQYKERLEDPAWSDIGSWFGDGTAIRLFDQQSLPARRQRFYRTQILRSLP